MELSSLTAVSPIDGRYGHQVTPLRVIFSEYALLKFRIEVEVRWLQQLSSCLDIDEVPVFSSEENDFLDRIISSFNTEDAIRIKRIEKTINHDVKAVEYFLKEKVSAIPSLSSISEFIHFSCTSEDINNLAYALMLKTARCEIIIPYWKEIINVVKMLSIKYRDIPLLARTHGQPATTTTLGKEMANVCYRFQRQLRQLENIEILGKMNGAVGNYNAHVASYPSVNWRKLSNEFVSSLGIIWNPYTTQIEPHDFIAEMLHCITRFNTILLDFNRDIWGYISLNHFSQKMIPSEIGSSTMPHKINPIDFEKSEGNLGLANTLLEHLARKLPISRWQRDLTDSTVLRNIGVGFSYALIAYQSTLHGLSKLEVNHDSLSAELDGHWEVLAEPIQMVMRRYGMNGPYDQLKELTRGKKVSAKDITDFIEDLALPQKEKIRLQNMSPSTYIGHSVSIVDDL
ncbi:adenylosuccinate lyase [Candidatus Erwinia haradaeae]|uniref:Adenylosuccinate lyase n=1 Tax=Candidatus Erwinia haradaeae TaxID=1922217 RepID=A0A803GCZ5_9GAMM|nr:adenylosuccinate lyase [Candidatus Erwinia haradaeae]VFP88825.1 Adenylosuccinate lyase [Candidatus Erwinia haradaeae]